MAWSRFTFLPAPAQLSRLSEPRPGTFASAVAAAVSDVFAVSPVAGEGSGGCDDASESKARTSSSVFVASSLSSVTCDPFVKLAVVLAPWASSGKGFECMLFASTEEGAGEAGPAGDGANNGGGVRTVGAKRATAVYLSRRLVSKAGISLVSKPLIGLVSKPFIGLVSKPQTYIHSGSDSKLNTEIGFETKLFMRSYQRLPNETTRAHNRPRGE